MKTSTEGTEYMLKQYQEALPVRQRQLAELESAQEVIVKAGSKTDFVWITVSATDTWQRGEHVFEGRKEVKLANGRTEILCFEDEKRRQVQNLKNQVKSIEEAIVFFKKKIAEFQPVV